MITDANRLEGMDANARRELLARLLRERATGSGAEFELSSGQEALWFLHELAPDSAAYNVAFCARVRSEVDPKRLERALLKLMERHSMLRCTVVRSTLAPRQRIGPVPEHCLETVDASGLEEEGLRALVNETYARPFDLVAGPVFRCILFSCCPTEHVLLLNVHHVFSDAWSFGILVSDLMTLYEDPTALAPLSPTAYADYVKWQRAALDSGEGRHAWEYWQGLLKDLSSTRLPADYPRPKMQNFRGASHHFELPAELCDAIRTLARAQDATLFMVVAAALHALLVRYCGSPLVPIGTPLFGRSRREDESTVGYFINPVVLCAPVQPGMTFRQHIADMRSAAIEAQRFGEFPFPELVKRFQPIRDASEMPIFQVMLNLIKASQLAAYKDLADADAQIRMGSLVLQDFPLDQQQGQFDLDLELFDTGGAIPATFKYRTDLFEKATIERLAAHFLTMLSAAVADPELRISDLPLLADAERQQLLVTWNETQTKYPKETSLAQLVEDQVERTPEATAVLARGRRLTYRELNRRANQLARELCEHGAGADQVVAVFVSRSTDLVVALLAIVKTGAAYLPLDPMFPPERLSYMLEDSGSRWLVTDRYLSADLPRFAGTTIFLGDAGWRARPVDNFRAPVKPEELAYLIYTSGSTGKPKGVQIPRGALTNLLWSMREWLQMSERDRLLAVTTISFDIAGVDIWLPLLVGAQTVVASREEAVDGNALQDLLERYDITFLQATPITWRLLFESGWQGKSNLQAVCTGEAMPTEIAARLVPMVKRVWNLYGPTETTIWSTGFRVLDATPPIPIGRPIANTQIYILDERNQPVPVGVAGELWIGGEGLARGYLNRPKLTAEKFAADPFRGGEARMYRSGDLARYRADGTIECLGRIDHQVKIRGFRIELGEIETHLARHPAVREAVVIAREDTPGDKRLVAYYTTSPDAGSGLDAVGSEQFRAHLSANLPEYMVPAAYVQLDSLPLTANGKVDRKALPPPEVSALPIRPYEPPQGELETKAAEVWSNVLKVDLIGRHDDFFNLGGHSLLAVQVMSTLQKIFPGESLPLRGLFEAPTLERFARWIESHEEHRSQILVQMRPGGRHVLPFFCVCAAAGTALGMRPLASHLDENVPFYCIQHRGLEGSTPFATIEEAARSYVGEIRKLQPHGPYRLGGYCFGGTVAFEMARLLDQAGERVSALFLVDSINPGHLRSQPVLKMLGLLFGHWIRRASLHVRTIGSLGPHAWLAYAMHLLKTVSAQVGALAPRRADVQADERLMQPSSEVLSTTEEIIQRMEQSARLAARKFLSKPYPGEAIIIRARDSYLYPFDRRFLGWKPFILGSISSIEVDGDHDNFYLEPAVQQIAERINAKLRESPSIYERESASCDSANPELLRTVRA